MVVILVRLRLEDCHDIKVKLDHKENTILKEKEEEEEEKRNNG